ncbi:tRNA1(Val) (adenine(37)-N6)-methyltransferase [Vibrio sp. SCSIO 43137]|uniref:tRNA1(Val) (adenine(37)-N6)-methyltransferase n=1 Tax=Vibrio sp. SCSIO 43137 TaxID=3021011 RepID=UPI002306E38E|nr:tRNA1(Val) (adenine(37)-N6)-methyltransferase [Vibrio sp. SCSIO 43137]WCE30215.1 tRNA1(Val) (adenine(37)-N6)-methyltransferase [Vibrio sp. SCSIO 43137]
MNRDKKRTKDFKFKKFGIYGGFSGMPVSTDSVLLGAWIDLDQAETILDIGTGTGLLTLMCAQRSATAQITAIELEKSACKAAEINFQNSDWGERISLIQSNIVSWQNSQTFDTIVCNPPYFNSGEQSQSAQRAIARHTQTLNHASLLQQCSKRLSQCGKASFVLPLTEGERFIQLAKADNWFVSRLCKVKPTPSKPVNRLLIELTRTQVSGEESSLTISDQQGYSKEFTQLTKEFYLKM